MTSSWPAEYRYWVLTLIAAAEGCGLTPIRSESLHGLFFLSSALAPSYDENPLVGLVMKYRRGPYYPELDWHLTRLSVQRLLSITDYQIKRDRNGYYTRAKYAITKSGAAFVSNLLEIQIWEKRFQYFWDVASGFARLADEQIDAAVEQDDTYDAPGTTYDDVSRFLEPQTNRTIQRISNLSEALPKGVRHSNQDLLRAYAALLNLRAA